MSVKTISRSGGRSAPAAAAYRTGTAITDVRSGLEFDYTRKGGVEPEPVLLLPKDAPEWASDRAVLWNAVEQFETRKNATVAREFIVALPSELSPESRRRLAVAFAQELVDHYGFVADVAIHAPSKEGDERNHHAHILCSTRKLEKDGFTAKTRELDDLKTGAVAMLRQVWALRVNQELERNGVADRVDHRSHAARGLEILPTVHEGVAATEMARRGEASDRVANNQEIRAANAELLQIAAEHKELEAAVLGLLAAAEQTWTVEQKRETDLVARVEKELIAAAEKQLVADVEQERSVGAIERVEAAELAAFKERYGHVFNKLRPKFIDAYVATTAPELHKVGRHEQAALLAKYGPREAERKREAERARQPQQRKAKEQGQEL